MSGVVSAFDHLDSIGPQQIWDGLLVRGVHGERVTLALVELEPGAVVPEHSHDNEQLGILIRGSLTFQIGDESRDLAPGGTWRILSHVPHSVVTGPDGAVLVEVFAPIRDDWERFVPGEPQPPDLFV